MGTQAEKGEGHSGRQQLKQRQSCVPKRAGESQGPREMAGLRLPTALGHAKELEAIQWVRQKPGGHLFTGALFELHCGGDDKRLRLQPGPMTSDNRQ